VLGPAWRRHAIGVIAVVLLVTGGVLYCTTDGTSNAINDLEATCLRIGPLLAVIWLAYDQLKRVPVWLWCTLPVILVVLATRPRWLLVLVPLIVAAAVLSRGLWSRPKR
jgi:hypothetical protein